MDKLSLAMTKRKDDDFDGKLSVSSGRSRTPCFSRNYPCYRWCSRCICAAQESKGGCVQSTWFL
jgi:hypothetical protein